MLYVEVGIISLTYVIIQSEGAVSEDICTSLEENRKEIEETLLVMASQSNEHRRRLDDSLHDTVTSFELGSDVISFFDCFCDKSNPGNDGCSKKTLMFAEAVAKAVSQKSMVIGENPAEVLLKVRVYYCSNRSRQCMLHSFPHMNIRMPDTFISGETHQSLEADRSNRSCEF